MRIIHTITGIGCCLFLLIACMAAGCTDTTGTETSVANETTPAVQVNVTQAETTTTPASEPVYHTIFVNATSNEKIIKVSTGDRVLIRLEENPTTGYTWNATVSKGLAILRDSYIAPDTTTMTGVPGYHEWILSPESVDTYTFKAISLRPWEGAQPTDDSFSVIIQATKS